MYQRLLLILFVTVVLVQPALCKRYQIDPAKSQIGFNVKHFGLQTVYGKYTNFEGEFEFDPANLKRASTYAKISATSINTGIRPRDDHLRGIFNVKDFPEITFKSQGQLIANEKGGFDIPGELTIKGITKPIILHAVEIKSSSNSADRLTFRAYTFVLRKDFGISWSNFVEQSSSVEQTINVSLLIEGVAGENNSDNSGI